MTKRHHRIALKCITAITAAAFGFNQSSQVFAEETSTSATSSGLQSSVVSDTQTSSSALSTDTTTTSSKADAADIPQSTVETSETSVPENTGETTPAIIERTRDALVSIENHEETNPVFQIHLTGDETTKLVKSARVAIWSVDKGQDDLAWLVLPVTDNQGNLTVDIAQLKQYRGKDDYTVHVYVYYADGSSRGFNLGTLAFSIPAPTVAVEMTDDTTYKLTVSGLTSNFTDVELPIWSEKNGQDDLKWYKANRLDNGDWEVTVSVAQHQFTTGHYAAHLYAKNSTTGKRQGILASQGFDFTEEQRDALPVTLTTALTDNGIQINFQSAKVTNPKNLKIAVWSDAKGQDDIRWYSASSVGEVLAAYKNHKGYGAYHVHVYLNENKKMYFQKAATFTIDKPQVQSTITAVSKTQYKITVSNVPNYMDSIQIPVWSDNKGQDDLKWYTATKQADGTYQTTVSVTNHKYDLGRYQAHI